MCSALKVEMPDKPSESPEQFRDRMVEVQTEFPEFLDQIWPNLTKFPGQFFGAFVSHPVSSSRVMIRLPRRKHDYGFCRREALIRMTGAGVTRVILSASVWVLPGPAPGISVYVIPRITCLVTWYVHPVVWIKISSKTLWVWWNEGSLSGEFCVFVQLFAEPFGSSLCNKPSKVSVNVSISFVNSWKWNEVKRSEMSIS